MEWPEVTINTPLSEVQAIHKRIWNYVIKNGEKPDTPYMYDCVLCEYATEVFDHLLAKGRMRYACLYCPFRGTSHKGPCLGGLYREWQDKYSYGRGTNLARQIRDIPFKEEGYWKSDLPDSQ